METIMLSFTNPSDVSGKTSIDIHVSWIRPLFSNGSRVSQTSALLLTACAALVMSPIAWLSEALSTCCNCWFQLELRVLAHFTIGMSAFLCFSFPYANTYNANSDLRYWLVLSTNLDSGCSGWNILCQILSCCKWWSSFSFSEVILCSNVAVEVRLAVIKVKDPCLSIGFRGTCAALFQLRIWPSILLFIIQVPLQLGTYASMHQHNSAFHGSSYTHLSPTPFCQWGDRCGHALLSLLAKPILQWNEQWQSHSV